MSNLIFPAEHTRTVEGVGTAGTPYVSEAGLTAVIYNDAAGLNLAGIAAYPSGSSIPTAQLTLDAYGRLPFFYGPDTSTTLLYVKVGSGPVTPIFARCLGSEDPNVKMAHTAVIGGSNAAYAPLLTATRTGRPLTIAWAGDSITDAASAPSSGGLPDRTTDGITSFGPKAIPFWALQYSGGQYTYGGVFATIGYTAAQWRATYLASVVAATPDMCAVLLGTNPGTSLVQDFTDLDFIYTTLRNAGIRPVLCTVPPKGTGTLTDNSATTKLNTWIRRYARTNRLPLVDYYAVLVDPTTGAYAATLGNADGIHPLEPGAKLMGQAFAAAMQATYGTSSAADLAVTEGGNTALLLAHPLNLTMVGSGPSVPQDWTALAGIGTGTITNPTVAGVVGKMATYTRGDTDINMAGATMTLVAGHRYQVAFKCQFTAGSGSLNFRWENTTAGTNWLWAWNSINQDMPLGTQYFEFVAPSGLSSYSYRPRIQVVGAGAIFGLGQYTAQDLTANGIA